MTAFDAVLWDYGGVFTASPFGAVNDVIQRLGLRTRCARELLAIPFRFHAKRLQRIAQDWQQPMNPLIGSRLSHAE